MVLAAVVALGVGWAGSLFTSLTVLAASAAAIGPIVIGLAAATARSAFREEFGLTLREANRDKALAEAAVAKHLGKLARTLAEAFERENLTRAQATREFDESSLHVYREASKLAGARKAEFWRTHRLARLARRVEIRPNFSDYLR